MLVLNRSEGEKVEIVAPPSDKPALIVVTMLGDWRVGFEAPREVTIHRQELADAIRREATRAVTPLPPLAYEGLDLEDAE